MVGNLCASYPEFLNWPPVKTGGGSKDLSPISVELKQEREICILDLLNLDKLSWWVKINFSAG